MTSIADTCDEIIKQKVGKLMGELCEIEAASGGGVRVRVRMKQHGYSPGKVHVRGLPIEAQESSTTAGVRGSSEDGRTRFRVEVRFAGDGGEGQAGRRTGRVKFEISFRVTAHVRGVREVVRVGSEHSGRVGQAIAGGVSQWWSAGGHV